MPRFTTTLDNQARMGGAAPQERLNVRLDPNAEVLGAVGLQKVAAGFAETGWKMQEQQNLNMVMDLSTQYQLAASAAYTAWEPTVEAGDPKKATRELSQELEKARSSVLSQAGNVRQRQALLNQTTHIMGQVLGKGAAHATGRFRKHSETVFQSALQAKQAQAYSSPDPRAWFAAEQAGYDIIDAEMATGLWLDETGAEERKVKFRSDLFGDVFRMQLLGPGWREACDQWASNSPIFAEKTRDGKTIKYTWQQLVKAKGIASMEAMQKRIYDGNIRKENAEWERAQRRAAKATAKAQTQNEGAYIMQLSDPKTTEEQAKTLLPKIQKDLEAERISVEGFKSISKMIRGETSQRDDRESLVTLMDAETDVAITDEEYHDLLNKAFRARDITVGTYKSLWGRQSLFTSPDYREARSVVKEIFSMSGIPEFQKPEIKTRGIEAERELHRRVSVGEKPWDVVDDIQMREAVSTALPIGYTGEKTVAGLRAYQEKLKTQLADGTISNNVYTYGYEAAERVIKLLQNIKRDR